jgi:uncharacterized protein YcfL
MKTLLSLIVILMVLIGCTDEENSVSFFQQAKFRKISYNSLSAEEAATLTKDWRLAPVKLGVFNNDNNINAIVIDKINVWSFRILDPNIKLTSNQILVAVTFNTKNDPLIGPLTLIIEPQSEVVIGGVLRF